MLAHSLTPAKPASRARSVALAGLALLLAACARQRAEPAPGAPARPAASASSSSVRGTEASRSFAPAPPPQASLSTAPDASAVSDDPARPRIDVQPLGAALPELDVAFVERSLTAFYTVEVRRLERVELPQHALNAARGRYRAEKLLSFLEARREPRTRFVLGLTGADISTTKPPHADWGILGLATLNGSACVISAYRTRRLAKSEEHARVRLGKVAVHEVGHNLGLDHCPERGCLMEDAMGTVLTTDREYDLCASCRERLGEVARQTRGPELPWPRPGAP